MFPTEKNNTMWIVFIIAAILFLFRKKLLSLFKNDGSNLNNTKWGNGTSKRDYYNFILDFEGGLSGIDTWSSFAPGTEYNVNKGIGYDTYVQWCNSNDRTPSTQEFIDMPYQLWEQIADSLFWDKWNLDSMDSNALKHLIHSWAWGSGNGGAEVRFANWIRSQYTPEELSGRVNNYNDISKSEIVDIINGYNPETIFDILVQQRADDFATMPNFSAYGNGWLSRLDSFNELHKTNG